MLNGILLPGNLSYFGYDLNVVLKLHVQTAGKCEIGLGLHVDFDLLGKHLPMAVAHAGIAQPLNQGYVWSEFLNLATDFHGHILACFTEEEKRPINQESY